MLARVVGPSGGLFATESGHNIEFDQPDAAVGAIVQMVEHVRGQRSQDSDGILRG
jgi:hypothetical protein